MAKYDKVNYGSITELVKDQFNPRSQTALKQISEAITPYVTIGDPKGIYNFLNNIPKDIYKIIDSANAAPVPEGEVNLQRAYDEQRDRERAVEASQPSQPEDTSREIVNIDGTRYAVGSKAYNELISNPKRLAGESISDFTNRLDEPSSSLDIITDNVTGKQYYRVSPTDTYKPYTGQIPQSTNGLDIITDNVTGQQFFRSSPTDTYKPYSGGGQTGAPKQTSGGTPVSGAQNSSGGSTGGSSGGAAGSTGGYMPSSPIVGTSASERLKQLQKELGIGQPPSIPDLFTNANQKELDRARQDRNSIDTELSQILDERLRLDEEFSKFKNYQKGLPEAGRIGAISEEERNLQERLNVLNRRELVLETKLRNRNTVISELMGLQKEDYANAAEQYNTKFSQALQLYDIFDKEQDEVKQNAKANLDVFSSTLQAQIESGNLNFNQITGIQRAKLEELEAQAGLPTGSTLAVLQTLKPSEEKLWSGVDDFGNFVYISRDTNGQISVKKAAGAVPQRAPKESAESKEETLIDSLTEQVLDGFTSLDDLTPTEELKVRTKLFELGYNSDTPPVWFRDYIENKIGMSLTNSGLQEEWEKEKDRVAGGGSGLDFEDF